VDSAAASEALRNGTSPELRHRRAVAALSLVSATSMGVISLYQTGLVKHLPEPPLGLFDADRVDAAADAYPLGVPDATLGLVSYGVTLALAAAGGASQPRWLRIALAGKTALDGAAAVKLTLDQRTKHRAYCSWCLLASAATLATVPFVAVELARGFRGT